MSDERRRGVGPASPFGPDPSGSLPFAPTGTPNLDAGATLDLPSPALAATEGYAGGTLDLPASDQVAAAGALAPGQMIGHFVIRQRLGEGGMGIVVAGHDADLGRPVAIKLVRTEADHPAYRARLLREAQAMARLEHPHVVRVYEVGSDRGRLFVAMELVDGVTLSVWLRAQPRSWREVVAMFVQVGAGLSAVHRAGLIHRDFKPDNVLVDRTGHARVADFGLARLDREQVASSGSPELAAPLTRTGMMLGTPGYMAPEQQFGGDVDARADQYSYCVALRECLLGGRGISTDDPRWSALPPAVRAVIARGLSYEPHERYASMDDLIAALNALSAAPAPPPTGRRRTAMLGAIAAVLVVAGVATAIGIATSGKRGSRIAPEPGREVIGLAGSGGAGSADEAPVRDVTVRHGSADDTPGGLAGMISAGLADAGTPPPAPPDAAPRIARAPDAPIKATRPRPSAGSAAVVAPPDPSASAAPPPPIPPPAGSGSSVPPRLPAATVGDPGHLPVVRATIRDLGYDGYDAATTQADVDAATGIDRGIAKVKLAMIERRKGHLEPAAKLFEEATTLLAWPASGQEGIWSARAYTGLALCALATGKPALEHAQKAFINGNQDQTRFMIALAFYEKGDRETSHQMMVVAQMLRDPFIKPALAAWLTGTGLTL